MIGATRSVTVALCLAVMFSDVGMSSMWWGRAKRSYEQPSSGTLSYKNDKWTQTDTLHALTESKNSKEAQQHPSSKVIRSVADIEGKEPYIYDSDLPMFDNEHSINITALLGKTAVLNCRVRNIGNKTVSWIRHRDIHLLTVGRFSYTSDQRFAALHSDGSEDWLMKIHYLQERDAGWYECQISATPPMSHMIYLSVVEPETVIVGGPDVYINTGSRLALTCSIKYSPDPPAFIFWYHNEKLVSYDRSRDGVTVQTEKGHVSTSRLLIQYAELRHSGIYKCVPSNSSPKSVNVHVLAGEVPEAIKHENNSVSGTIFLPTSYLLLSSISCLSMLSLSHVILM